MILSGKIIKELMNSGDLIVKREAGKETTVNPASVDIHLSDKFTTFKFSHRIFIDSENLDDPVALEQMRPDGRRIVQHKYTDEYLGVKEFYVHSKDALFTVSEEKIKLPDNVSAKFYGASNLLRMGVEIKSASSWSEFLEPGFQGDLRLFIKNNAWVPIKLYPGQVVGRLVFEGVE